MQTADVVVVGGGPAGAAAAIALARRGRDVMVVDKATFPRDKICGDGLTAGALRLLEDLGLDPAAVPSWKPVDDVVVRSPSGHEVTFPLPRGAGLYAAVARRTELDAAPARRGPRGGRQGARRPRVHRRRGARRPGRARGRGDRPGRGALRHRRRRHVVADAQAPRRGHPGYRGEWHAFRQYFTDVGPRASAGAVRVVRARPAARATPGRSRCPTAAPTSASASSATAARSPACRTWGRCGRELLARPHIAAVLGPDARPESPHRAWPIPARVDDIVLTTRRTLFVGDAAPPPTR